ncbi:MAG TPA: UDPGP type 1 family protein [bacterium]|nr:UDPGP type 1 family protein [bacterium]HQG46800.1 UDPGP type 1 family protein [bacterium]HQI48025.1 UDPGP type 1 family protein [bacterium]HQJ63595.1 UDPGP type 1 family protein [bacterium]
MESLSNRYRRMRQKTAGWGQESVLRFWDDLDPAAQEQFLDQLDQLDEAFIASLNGRAWPPSEFQSGPLDAFTPLDHIPLPAKPDEEPTWQRARQCGEALLAEGAVAALVVAGGQGTRLGFPGPKGLYPIGPVSRRSLFQYHTEKILALERRFGCIVPFYIMTSPANHQATRDFFIREGFFGKDSESVHFFPQRMLPVFDPQGRLLLEDKGKLSLSPDGHGGVLHALKQHHLLEDMQQRGIRHLYYFQVDNVLARIADPVYLGFHHEKAAEMSARTVYKRDPWEKLGNIGLLGGQFRVIEYTELPEALKTARNRDGRLLFGQGSIAIHLFSVDFLDRLLRQRIELPYHIAFKKMASVPDQAPERTSDGLNAVKFEQFIFDAFRYASRVMVLESDRRLEFSPIKNREGDDSPETARRDLSELYAGWLEACGRPPKRHADGSLAVRLEISPLVALSAEELKSRLPAHLNVDADLLLEDHS